MSTNLTGPAARRYPRFPLDIRVSAKVFRPEAPIDLWGRSIEFGQDGIGVTLTGELEPGEVATLELTLPGSSTPADSAHRALSSLLPESLGYHPRFIRPPAWRASANQELLGQARLPWAWLRRTLDAPPARSQAPTTSREAHRDERSVRHAALAHAVSPDAAELAQTARMKVCRLLPAVP